MAFTTISRRTSLLILLLAVVIHYNRFSSVKAAKNSSIFLQRWWKQRRLDKSSSRNNDQKKKKKKGDGKMGQVIRIMKYDRAKNERNAIEGLKLIGSSSPLHWFRLDDGVMGGQSETNHQYLSSEGVLKFEGTINTNGGGFCSIRGKASSPSSSSSSASSSEVGVVPTKTLLPPETSAIRICVHGDGKTYKLLLSDGNKSMFGPGKRSPSWQADIPTNVDKETILEIPLTSFQPSFGPSKVSGPVDPLDAGTVQEIGFMLSLKLSDGSPNPVATFGEGTFPFCLQIKSIEPVLANQ